MYEQREIYTMIARIDERLNGIESRFERIEETLKELRADEINRDNDHEIRIRELERHNQTLYGKLAVISAGASALIAFIIGWLTTGGRL